MRHCSRLAGFTLLEMVITIGVAIFMIGGLSLAFVSYQNLYSYQAAYHAATGTVGRAMRAFEEAARPATSVLASHLFTTGTTYGSDATTLVLQLPAVDASGAVITGATDYVALYRSGGSAYVLVDTAAASARRGGTILLGTNVTSLTFSYDNADVASAHMVGIDLTASSTVKSSSAASHASETVRLRNL